MSAVFEWRSEYIAHLVETEDGNLEVIIIIISIAIVPVIIIYPYHLLHLVETQDGNLEVIIIISIIAIVSLKCLKTL